jgi:opacity protein-like surface antigen
MKKLLYSFLFVLPLIINAQVDKLKVSIMNGPTFGWMTSNDSKILTSGTKLGYKLHVEAEYLLSERYSFTGGIGLSLNQGGKLEYLQGGNLWSESLSDLSIIKGDSMPNGVILGYGINYVDFPVGFKLRTNEFGKFKFYAHLPEFMLGFKTKAKGSIKGAGINTEKENISKQATFLSLGWGIGAGAEYKISDDVSIIAGLRFTQSIIDVTDDDGRYFDGSKENSKGTINSLDLRIGVAF